MDDPKKKIVTALQSLAKAECCNWFPDGCIKLSTRRSPVAKPCVLLAGERCDWFERAVMPLGDHNYPYALQELVKKYSNAIDSYRYFILSEKKINANICNDCGTQIPPHHRYCDSCKRKRRRLADKEEHKKWRRVKTTTESYN